MKNDIALVELKSDIPAEYPRIKIPNQNDYSVGNVVKVIGWGATEWDGPSASRLQEVQVPIVSDEKCDEAYADYGGIFSSNICAGLDYGGKDSCQGDSGGPLFYKNGNTFLQVGVVSWGHECAAPGYYGIYTEAAYFIDWIEGIVGESVTGDGSTGDNTPDDPGPTDPDNGCYRSPVHLDVKIDKYGYETWWKIKSRKIKNITDGYYPANQRIKDSFDLPSGDYRFLIFDDWGDGLAEGGFYKLTDDTGRTIAEGVDFGYKEKTSFCVQ